MRIAVVEHQPDAPAGLFGAWAQARGHELELLRAPRLETWPDPRGYGAVVTLGSDRSVHASPDAWIAAEIGFLRAAHETGVPVLGLCFGAQALAAALGGEVLRAPSAEIGWIHVEGAGAGAGPVVPGPWFAWHEDTFTVPPAARELARSPVAPQAFVMGASVGLQFHPEVDERIVGEWVDGGRRQLAAARIDEQRLRAETARRAPQARRRAFELFDAVARRWVGPRRVGRPAVDAQGAREGGAGPREGGASASGHGSPGGRGQPAIGSSVQAEVDA
jgi:GMP synthase-like glutamine amidotransferase